MDPELISTGNWRVKLEYNRDPVELTIDEVVERLCRLDGDIAYKAIDGHIYAYFANVDSEISSEECQFNLARGNVERTYGTE